MRVWGPRLIPAQISIQPQPQTPQPYDLDPRLRGDERFGKGLGWGAAQGAVILATDGLGEAFAVGRTASFARLSEALGAEGLAAESNILRQAGGIDRAAAYPRTAGLGTHASMAELRTSGALPGVDGVILTDKTVLYADVYGLATQGGRRVEFSLVSETVDGAQVRKLYSGDAWSSPVPRDARLIGHAHPNPGATQMWASSADMEIANARYFRSLQANPNARPLPNHIFWGAGPEDVTTYYGGFGKW